MQYGLFRSGNDLDFLPFFQYDLLRSNYSSLDASRQEEHDAGNMNVLPLLRQKLLPNFFFLKRFVLEFVLSGG